MTSVLVAGLLVAAALVVGRRSNVGGARALAVLEGPWLPVLAGLVAAAAVAAVWGSLAQVSVYHDEAAYRLQAELFARLRWSLPSPAVPRAFEQAAVLVTPVVAPKMPLGHALALVPGVWLGLPGSMPVLLTGVSAGLLVALARRVAGAPVALLTFVVWLTAPGNLRWRASYMSEVSSGAAWLGAWWCLLGWRRSGAQCWLLGLAALVGWGAVTRPLTMLAFAVPLAVVVVRDVARARRWGQLGAALGVGIAVLALLPLQNAMTLGDWKMSPLALYTRQYLPFDVPGFGLVETPPERPLPPDLAEAFGEFEPLHRAHQPARLAWILTERARSLVGEQFAGWRSLLAPLALLGLVPLLPEVGFAVATALAVLLTGLLYAHRPEWTVYYLETLPVFSFVAALGAWRGLAWLARRARGAPLAAPNAAALATLAGLVCLAPSALEAARLAERLRYERQYYAHFEQAMAALPEPRLLVFVRYGRAHPAYFSLVRNVADPDAARVITAYDLGPQANDALRAAFPGRAAYLLDDGEHTVERLRDLAP